MGPVIDLAIGFVSLPASAMAENSDSKFKRFQREAQAFLADSDPRVAAVAG